MNMNDIEDYAYICSSIGNAYFSGLTFSELWDCVLLSTGREELDAAIEITIKLKEIHNDK
jgi:hypothetical protein